MPKLSEKTLEKRFQCEYCDSTFRTRQGLSGHIQFKHQDYYKSMYKTKEIDVEFILSKAKYFKTWRLSNGLPGATNDGIAKLMAKWSTVRSLFAMLGIGLNEQDFKIYLLAGLGKLFI